MPTQPLSVREILEAKIREASRRGLGRHPDCLSPINRTAWTAIGNSRYLNFMSNDYLGLANHKPWREKVGNCFRTYSPSSSASRLAGGHSDLIAEAEAETAEYFGFAECIFLPSGYQANLALMTGIIQPGQPVLVDRRIHASMGRALPGTRGDIHPYAHADLAHLERRLDRLPPSRFQSICLTESLFSMDGTIVDATHLAALKQRKHFFLIIDEAHALGCLGEGGRGVFAAHPGTADIGVGTLGKGLGFFGAFLLLPKGFTPLLENLSSPIMHSTAMPPAHAQAIRALIRMLPAMDDRRERLHDNAVFFRRLLASYDIPTRGCAHIIAVPIGDAEKASLLSAQLRNRGILALAARYPTVPPGDALLRFSITAEHAEEDLRYTADNLYGFWKDLN